MISNLLQRWNKLSKAKKIALIGVAAGLAVKLQNQQSKRKPRKNNEGNSANKTGIPNQQKKKKNKVAVDAQFIKKLKSFWPIIIPGKTSPEFLSMVGIAIILLIRSGLDIWMIKNNADVVAAIVDRDRDKFVKHVVYEFFLMQFPTSLINNGLKFLISTLQKRVRERLTIHLHEQYMSGITAYGVSNLDNRIDNADQLLTQDIKSFADSFGTLYSNMSKPIFDVILFYLRLVQRFGIQGPSLMLFYFFAAGSLMTKLRTPFARFTTREAELEGYFRYHHSRVITYSEEVSFYRGEKREHELLDRSLRDITTHVGKYHRFRFFLGVFDSMITKYTATAIAYFVVSAPIFDPKNAYRYVPALGGDTNQIMRDYTSYVRLLFSMVTAIGRLVDSGRELSRFAGHTQRVHQLRQTLTDIRNGRFQRTMLTQQAQVQQQNGDGGDGDGGDGKKEKERRVFDLNKREGEVVICGEDEPVIKFESVPIVTPNGDLLVDDLSFAIAGGENTLISGPNGSGKSSLFRILGGLWPLYAGKLTRPQEGRLFYVPQKPYLCVGTLRDQVAYPHTHTQLIAKGVTDADLMGLMQDVSLEYVVEREGGWDAVADWADVLSGGEKQRIAMARLFYHKPQFAILDECTSAVSVDVEGNMYTRAREQGITLFTVSHRKSLWKYHEYKLHLTGRGGYTFERIDHSKMEDAFGS